MLITESGHVLLQESTPRIVAIGAAAANSHFVRVLVVLAPCSERPFPANRPLAISAAKVPDEPNPCIGFSCCARTQRENCGDCSDLAAAQRQENQPFVHFAEKTRATRIKSRDFAVIHLSGFADAAFARRRGTCVIATQRVSPFQPFKSVDLGGT